MNDMRRLSQPAMFLISYGSEMIGLIIKHFFC
jgi:hypothetical protein